MAGDVRDHEFLRRAVDETVAARGRLDIVVNNAGGPPPGTFDSTPDEAWAEAFELSLNAAVRLTRLALPHLRASGRGRVVNIASWSVREPIPNLLLSNAIRPGVIGWAKTIAHELGPDGITVNTVAPGKIDTPRVRELWQHHPDPAAAERTDIGLVPGAPAGQPRRDRQPPWRSCARPGPRTSAASSCRWTEGCCAASGSGRGRPGHTPRL